MLEQGRLCEQDACVDPWRYGSPTWGTCPDEPLATADSLGEKAVRYDELAARLHIHPELDWIANVTIAPGVSEGDATWEDVERWWTGENDGLWSALYLTSQAFRYAVTRSEESLANVRQLLDGMATRMAVTGVPGLFTRQYIPPGVPGISCPQDDENYVVDVEKDDNQWVRVGDDGCVWVVDPDSREWQRSDHCGLDAFADWCWLDNVSVDEYSGHMFALIKVDFAANPHVYWVR